MTARVELGCGTTKRQQARFPHNNLLTGASPLGGAGCRHRQHGGDRHRVLCSASEGKKVAGSSKQTRGTAGSRCLLASLGGAEQPPEAAARQRSAPPRTADLCRIWHGQARGTAAGCPAGRQRIWHRRPPAAVAGRRLALAYPQPRRRAPCAQARPLSSSECSVVSSVVSSVVDTRTSEKLDPLQRGCIRALHAGAAGHTALWAAL